MYVCIVYGFAFRFAKFSIYILLFGMVWFKMYDTLMMYVPFLLNECFFFVLQEDHVDDDEIHDTHDDAGTRKGMWSNNMEPYFI